MITSSRRLEWDAMHRIPQHQSRCRACHGHRHVGESHCIAEEPDHAWRIVGFAVVKERLGGWIDPPSDHTAILVDG